MSSVEAMQESYRARRRDLEDCTQIRIADLGQNQSCAIEVSIVPQNQWRKRLAAVGSVEVIKSLERSSSSDAVDGAAVCRSPIFGSSVISTIRAFDGCSPWERAIALVERVQDCEFPARADFENSPVVRGAVFIRRAVEVSVGAERESAGRECACYSIKVVKYAQLSRRSDLKNRARIVSSTIVGCAVEVPIPALNNSSRIIPACCAPLIFIKSVLRLALSIGVVVIFLMASSPLNSRKLKNSVDPERSRRVT